MTMNHDADNERNPSDQPLPADNFGVFVENDMDLRRLQWLATEIGERKLRSSVQKYNRRYPDCKPFVSLLLRWYHLTVPPSVYAPTRVPMYGVYLLLLVDESMVKIGSSGGWTARARSLVHLGERIRDLFDLDRSVFHVIGTRAAARSLERTLLEQTLVDQCEPPQAIAFGAGGRLEWRHGRSYPELLQRLAAYTVGTPPLTLRLAMHYDELMHDAVPSADHASRFL